jgi:hypothetical protein
MQHFGCDWAVRHAQKPLLEWHFPALFRGSAIVAREEMEWHPDVAVLMDASILLDIEDVVRRGDAQVAPAILEDDDAPVLGIIHILRGIGDDESLFVSEVRKPGQHICHGMMEIDLQKDPAAFKPTVAATKDFFL